MKQLYLSLLYFLIIASASCNSEDNAVPVMKDNNSIHFGDNIITSKALIEDITLPANSQIGIFSWGHKPNESITDKTLRKDLNNSLYTKTSDSNSLISDTEAHFPINPDTLLNFYAYYPYTIAATATPLSIPFDLNRQDDIMWATPVLNRDKTTAAETVNLSFNHVLSAITLKFKKADDIKEDMILQSISLENYPSAIQLNVQTGKLTATASTIPYTIISGQQKEMTSEEVAIVTNYLLYPVEKPVFIVRMSDKDYRIQSSKAFEGGKKQTYSFTIQAKDISISGSINPWIEGGESNETVYF